MKRLISSRDLASGGLFGAAALLLPLVFHLLHLGPFLMPMYIPLIALAFIAEPAIAAWTAFIVPLLSFFLTSMPPIYPPIAPVMAVELGLMCLLISMVMKKQPTINKWIPLTGALFLGRLFNFGALYLLAKIFGLPAGFVAGLSLISGWPGIILILLIIPPTISLLKKK
jgi:niacin transporter